MKIVAVIPARGGSKGLPKKNKIDLGGKPLIAWTIEASNKSEYITKTLVSSDDDTILDISLDFGAEFIKRPQELALDTTPSESVVEHALNQITNIEDYDFVVLLQPTSPLRNEVDIDAAIKELIETKATALISTKKIDNKILKAFKKNDNQYLESIFNNNFPFMRRQDLPDVYMPNGAIYIVSIQDFLKTKKLFTDKTLSFKMNEDKSFDIDTIDDLNKCRELIKKKF